MKTRTGMSSQMKCTQSKAHGSLFLIPHNGHLWMFYRFDLHLNERVSFFFSSNGAANKREMCCVVDPCNYKEGKVYRLEFKI